MSGHYTPGWVVDRDDTTLVLDGKGRPKCEVYGDGQAEWTEDARLISAAPDMAEALQEMLVSMKAIRAGEWECCVKARAALEKAGVQA